MKKVVAKLMLGILTTSLLGNNLMTGNVVYASEPVLSETEEYEFIDAEDNLIESASQQGISITYRVHCQTHGDMDWVKEGELSGTQGEAKRLEAIWINMENNTGLEGDIVYTTHVQSYGWQGDLEDESTWAKNGELSGTQGEAKRLESIKIKLTGELAEKYDVLYRVHCQTWGWTDWVSNGMEAGTTGQGKRLEAIQINLVEKASTDKSAEIQYTTHVQTYGWLDPVGDGEMSGTEGQAKRLEGIKIQLVNSDYTGAISYKVHAQTYGWMYWMSNYTMSGTSGEAKRLEAIQIMLTGEVSTAYDVYYRVHSQTYGWLGWAMNGQIAGTSGLSKRLEGIEICLVEKGGKAPGTTDRPYVYPALLEQEKQEAEKDENPGGSGEIIPPSENPIVPGVPTDSTNSVDILNSAQLYSPCYTGDAEIDARVRQILSQIITDDMTTYEKTKAIYDWIMNNTYYAFDPGYYRGNYESIYDTWVVSQSYSVLCKGYGTCVNYASAFVVLTRAIGLESYKIYGGLFSAYGGTSGHAWAVVNINGTLYTFDPQIGDDAYTDGWGSPYDYFCKPDDDPTIKNYYINIDDQGTEDTSDDLYRSDYINGFNFFKQY